jgi:hypothetical protein
MAAGSAGVDSPVSDLDVASIVNRLGPARDRSAARALAQDGKTGKEEPTKRAATG